MFNEGKQNVDERAGNDGTLFCHVTNTGHSMKEHYSYGNRMSPSYSAFSCVVSLSPLFEFAGPLKNTANNSDVLHACSSVDAVAFGG